MINNSESATLQIPLPYTNEECIAKMKPNCFICKWVFPNKRKPSQYRKRGNACVPCCKRIELLVMGKITEPEADSMLVERIIQVRHPNLSKVEALELHGKMLAHLDRLDLK